MVQKFSTSSSVSYTNHKVKSSMQRSVSNVVLANDKMRFLLLPLFGVIFSPIYLVYAFLHVFKAFRDGESKLIILGHALSIDHLNGFYDDLRNTIKLKVNGDITRCNDYVALFSLGVGMGLIAVGIMCLQYTLTPLALSLVVPEILVCASVGVKASICLFVSGSIIMSGIIRLQKSKSRYHHSLNLGANHEKISVKQSKSSFDARKKVKKKSMRPGLIHHSEKKN